MPATQSLPLTTGALPAPKLNKSQLDAHDLSHTPSRSARRRFKAANAVQIIIQAIRQDNGTVRRRDDHLGPTTSLQGKENRTAVEKMLAGEPAVDAVLIKLDGRDRVTA